MINLHDLGTTGLLHYTSGISPYYPHAPLAERQTPPSRTWRLKQCCLVIESRFGIDSKARAAFLLAAQKDLNKLKQS